MATELKLEAPWDQVKEMIKEVNTDITDDDLTYEPGNAEALLNKLARKMNRTPEEIKGWIESVSYNKGIAY